MCTLPSFQQGKADYNPISKQYRYIRTDLLFIHHIVGSGILMQALVNFGAVKVPAIHTNISGTGKRGPETMSQVRIFIKVGFNSKK
jgi:hypothetical protein